jgi:hypothetical protein
LGSSEAQTQYQTSCLSLVAGELEIPNPDSTFENCDFFKLKIRGSLKKVSLWSKMCSFSETLDSKNTNL